MCTRGGSAAHFDDACNEDSSMLEGVLTRITEQMASMSLGVVWSKAETGCATVLGESARLDRE